MEGRIRRLAVMKERGQPGEEREQGRFIKDLGMEAQERPGLCFRRYKANIETEGLDLKNLTPGTVLRAGTAAFQVSESIKECFPECPLFREGNVCRLSSGGIFLRVTETGEVSNNDKIAIGGI